MVQVIDSTQIRKKPIFILVYIIVSDPTKPGIWSLPHMSPAQMLWQYFRIETTATSEMSKK